jgi:hypothetical protein
MYFTMHSWCGARYTMYYFYKTSLCTLSIYICNSQCTHGVDLHVCRIPSFDFYKICGIMWTLCLHPFSTLVVYHNNMYFTIHALVGVHVDIILRIYFHKTLVHYQYMYFTVRTWSWFTCGHNTTHSKHRFIS